MISLTKNNRQSEYQKESEKMLKDLIEHYLRFGFGKILKTEIDILLFEIILKNFLLEESKMDYFFEGEVNLYMLSNDDINKLSKKLKVNVTKVNNLIETYALYKSFHNEEYALVMFFILINDQIQDHKELKDGKVNIQIVNSLLRNAIKNQIININGQVNYRINNEILEFDFPVLFLLFERNNKDFKVFLLNQRKKEIKDLDSFLTELNKKDISGHQLIKDIFFNIIEKYTKIDKNLQERTLDYLKGLLIRSN